jgi:hypothetical protein
MSCCACLLLLLLDVDLGTHTSAAAAAGGVLQAIGFVRASDAPEDQLERVVGRKGLMRCAEFCGAALNGLAVACVTCSWLRAVYTCTLQLLVVLRLMQQMPARLHV